MRPEFGAYGPSKAGAIALAKPAALENKDKGIRVNVVAPGPIGDTGMSDRLLGCARPRHRSRGPANEALSATKAAGLLQGSPRCLLWRSWAFLRTWSAW
jgi:NAD(P)-dependent dehydrogenase (short-subunit alcohol dehydrogenase family)